MTIEDSVTDPPRTLEQPAGYGSRLSAALLDGLLITVLIYAVLFPAATTMQSEEDGSGLFGVPVPFTILIAVIVGLYITVGGVLGRTLGMWAVGLRITGADGCEPGRVRLLGRAAALIFVLAALVWLHEIGALWGLDPLVLLAYSMWVLTNSRRQLPHDQLAGTVVVRRIAAPVSQQTLDKVRAHYGDLPTPVAKMLIGDLEQLRRRARGALHLASVPMFVLGLLALGTAAMSWNGDVHFFGASTIYLTLAAPAGLAATAWWFHRQQRSRGAGPGARSTVIITSFVTLVSLTTFFFPAPGIIAGAGFLAIAIIQRSLALGGAAIVFALVTSLELPWGVLSNALTNTSEDPFGFTGMHGSFTVFTVLALVLFAAAAVTLRRERVGA